MRIHRSPSEILKEVRCRLDAMPRAAFFTDMVSHIKANCPPCRAFVWTPSYAAATNKKFAAFKLGQIARLERIVALCLAVRSPEPTPHRALLLEAERLLAELDDANARIALGRKKGGNTRQSKIDPARRESRRLANEIRRDVPQLTDIEVAKLIESDVIRFVRDRRISVAPGDNFTRTLRRWITDSPLHE